MAHPHLPAYHPRICPHCNSATTSGTSARMNVNAATSRRGKTQQRSLTHPEIRAIVLGIMLAMFLGALDQTIVATALPTIGRHFGDLGDLSWVVTAYLLTGTAVTPLYGKLSDIHGRRADDADGDRAVHRRLARLRAWRRA